jgi:hypothetical protein
VLYHTTGLIELILNMLEITIIDTWPFLGGITHTPTEPGTTIEETATTTVNVTT